MTLIMARRQKHDSLSKRAEWYMKMGQEEKAMELPAKMEEDDNKPIISEEKEKEKDVPDNIEIPEAAVAPNQFSKGGNDDSDSDDNSANPNFTIKAACNPALDSGDNGSSGSSDHLSQPSDDSKKVKKTAV